MDDTGCGPEGLDALLREVLGLRRWLDRDLAVLASATDAGALQAAVDVVQADCAELAGLSERLLAGLPHPRPEPD